MSKTKSKSEQENSSLLNYQMVQIEKLIPYARNSRTHSDSQITKLASSIKEFGFINPVVVDGDNGILAGHGRVLAAQKLGISEVPCIAASHLTETQRRAYIIADNRMALDAGWDMEMLKVELEELQVNQFDLKLTGFDIGEISGIFLEKENGQTDAEKEWVGMPDYEDQDPCYKKVIVNFDGPEDVREFFSIIGQGYTDKTKSIWFPEKERRDLESVRWADDGEE